MEKNLLRGDKHELRNCLCINQKKDRDVDPDWWHRISLDQPTFPIQLQETAFERLPARGGQTSALFNNSKNLVSSCQELRPDTARNKKKKESEMRLKLQNSSIPVTRFQSLSGLLNHTGGTCSHGGMIGCPKFQFSELRLGKFHDSMDLRSWKVNFKTEACSNSADPHVTKHWIKEVQIAKSIYELMTPRSIVERNEFPDYDMLDAMNECVCIEKTSQHADTFPQDSNFRRVRKNTTDFCEKDTLRT